MQCYLVGGAVRDRLLKLPVKDRDYVVVGATPEDMLQQGFRQVGTDFPVFLHPDSGEEYALARTERKSAPGYRGFVTYSGSDISLEDDLRRRDLTINAMAEDHTGQLIDPFGGAKDLQQGILRHVSPSFSEDPLRVLRTARFAARFDFDIAPETLQLMRSISAGGELERLSPERVWTETEKALATNAPVRYIRDLRECHALAVLFPEIDALFGVPQRAEYHPEIDTGEHTLLALEQAGILSKETIVRFATLVHDLGKAATPKAEWPAHKKHDVRGVPIIEQLCQRLRVPVRYRELATLVSRYHIECHRILEMSADTVLKKLEALDAFRRPERFQQFLLCCRADVQGRKGKQHEPYPPADYLAEALKSCQRVDTCGLQKRGLEGREFAMALRQERIHRLRELRTTTH